VRRRSHRGKSTAPGRPTVASPLGGSSVTVIGNARRAAIDALVEGLDGVHVGHPLRVGIDGRSAAGKTTFADELAAALRGRGREVLRASLDDFD
jgi:putative protein kinase ArgK-like GTPase of G3E family